MAICAFVFFSNLRLSKQFTGWIEFKIEWTSAATLQKDIESKLADTNLRVTTNEDKWISTVLIQQNTQDEDKLLAHSKTLQAAYSNQLKEFAIVWPSIGKQISSTAMQAIIRWLVLMSLFIIFEFSKIRKVIQPFILAIITTFTMLFDMLTPMCIYGVMMWLNPTMQVDVIFIIALLTTMWYSITDTVVIFDRVREHIENDKNRNMAEIFENSLRETMTRSLMTWSGTLLSIIAMYLLWTWDLKSFAFTMFFGILSGTVSSIFLASPLAYLIIKYSGKHK